MLRSLAAVALVGGAGLLVPASSARLPFSDCVVLRNFGGDSPQDGLSSFALEMKDVR